MNIEHKHPSLLLTHSHQGSTVYDDMRRKIHDHYGLQTVYVFDFDSDPVAPPRQLSESETNRGYGTNPTTEN